MDQLAKPSGITYVAHRQHVFDEAMKLLKENPFWGKKYETLTNQNLENQVKRAAWWHDAGKCHPKWSNACRKDYELYRTWRRNNGLLDDIVNAADFKRYESEMRKSNTSSSPFLMKAKFRHEFDSLKKAIENFKDSEPLTLAESAAIASHHGKLAHRHKERWYGDGKGEKDTEGPFASLWNLLAGESQFLIEVGKKEWAKKVIERYKIAGVRAVLRLADTRASRAESGELVPIIEPFKYNFIHQEKNAVQEIAERVASKQMISILRAPTGSGKTDAALLWAKRQIENGHADRLVIAMPTRFTSNALAMSVEKNISATGLYHSSAWYNRYGDIPNAEKSNARELHKLAQFLATPVTVCTIDHLLMCLTGTKEDHHTTFFFLANSAVVFDEADFYDPFIQANLLVLLETLKILGVPVLIMSATIPDSLRLLYKIEQPILDVPAEKKSPNRSIVWRGTAETPEDVEGILKGMIRQRVGIVYANTVDRAYAYYKWFKKEHDESGGPKPVLYHSRFTEPDKKGIEEQLIQSLGKDAWYENRAEGVAILTQIGEMSVNISAPVMLSDICPWDRLAQRAGRLDRFGLSENGGILFVIEPTKDGTTYPAPYGEYLRGKGWITAPAFAQTREEIITCFDEVPQKITPQNFVDWVNNLYPVQSEFESKIKENRDNLKMLMKANWLIVSGQYTDEDEGSVSAEWKSRDIPPQETVFTSLPEDIDYDGIDKKVYPFKNWDEFRSYQLEYGISCPVYTIEVAKKLNQLLAFCYQIGDDNDKEKKILWILSPGIYEADIGLAQLGKGQKLDRAKGVTI